jgi:hypothetical protein
VTGNLNVGNDRATTNAMRAIDQDATARPATERTKRH